MRRVQALDIIIAVNLKIYRRRNNMSQSDAAKQLGITYQQLQKYESAGNRISAGRLWQLATIYNVPIENFFVR
tara:strand:+ start:768 stop:986 length:219 start_codon:yes stop_codon:yes gene_type:complete